MKIGDDETNTEEKEATYKGFAYFYKDSQRRIVYDLFDEADNF